MTLGLLVSVLSFGNTYAFHSQTAVFRYPHSPSCSSSLSSSSSSSSLKSSFSNDNDQPFQKKTLKRGDLEKLSAVSFVDYDLDSSNNYGLEGVLRQGVDATPLQLDELINGIKPVLAASLLITGNTIGAACLVMPEICEGPGLAVSLAVMVACFVTNLTSGLVIAEVAIKQYEASHTQAPSSFQELAEVNLDSNLAGYGVGAISLFASICVTTFDLARMGEVLAGAFTGITTNIDLAGSMVENPSVICSVGYAAVLALTASTMSTKQLGNLAGFACAGLFVTLTAILLPGLAAIQDPSAIFFSPGTASDAVGAAGLAAPIILSAMVYQNIVPSVTKRLNYDRQQTTAALAIGSFLPSVIYFLYSYVVMGGGGMEASESLLMTAFSVTTIVGSSIACVMSMSEELENFFNSNKKDKTSTDEMVGGLQQTSIVTINNNNNSNRKESQEESYSIPTVLFAVGVPLSLGICLSGGDDLTVPLRIAGSYGSPLLYGALPVAMAWNQRQKLKDLTDMLPGGLVSLGGLALLTTIYIVEEFVKDISGLLG